MALLSSDIHQSLTIRSGKASIRMPVLTIGYPHFSNVLMFLPALRLAFWQARAIFWTTHKDDAPRPNTFEQLYSTGLAAILSTLPITFFCLPKRGTEAQNLFTFSWLYNKNRQLHLFDEGETRSLVWYASIPLPSPALSITSNDRSAQLFLLYTSHPLWNSS